MEKGLALLDARKFDEASPPLVEALKAGWCPVFARDGVEVPKGNRELLKLGAATMPSSELAAAGNLAEWLREHAGRRPVERDLFE